MLIALLTFFVVAGAQGGDARTAAVSGRIHDGGRGGTVVAVEQVEAGAAPRRYTATINGRGEYRIFGIASGRYRLFATSLLGEDDVLRWGIVSPVLHAEFEVRGDEDLTGADFILPREVFTVSGRVGRSAQTSPSTMLTLVDPMQPQAPLWRRLVPASGTFEIAALVPGTYELRVFGASGLRDDTATPLMVVPFTIGTTNVDGIVIGENLSPAENPPAAALPVSEPAGPTGSVSGRVVDADTGQPLAGVVVAAQGPAAAGKAATGADGRYVLHGIAAGRATIGVNDGMRWPGLTVPRDVVVTADRDMPGIDFRVRLSGSIAGRVLSEENEPLAGVRVFAIRAEYGSAAVSGQQFGSGELSYFIQGQTVTDDRGHYEFERLFAGRSYRLVVFQPRTAAPVNEPLTAAIRSETLAATFYPSTASFDEAVAISLRSQERRELVDIQMRRLPTRCVDAELRRDGQPIATTFRVEDEEIARLQIIAGSPTTPAWRITGTSGADGRLRVCDLHQGRFRLVVEAGGTFRREALGTATFDVGAQDVRLGVVDVRPPLQFTGQVLWDVAPAAPAAAPQFSLRGAAFPGAVTLASNAPVPGRLAFEAFPGHYPLVVAGPVEPFSTMPHPYYVKDVTQGGVSIMHTGLRLTEARAPVVVMVGADAGAITARVVDEAGRPVAGAGVLIVAEAPAGGGARVVLAKAGHADAEGMFAAEGLAPGSYDAVAVEALPPFLVFRPSAAIHVERSPEALDAISRARAGGERVFLAPNARHSVSLRPVALTR